MEWCKFTCISRFITSCITGYKTVGKYNNVKKDTLINNFNSRLEVIALTIHFIRGADELI